MATAIIHVGMHKTGSSSIQTSLAALPEGRGPRIIAFRKDKPNASGMLRHAFDGSIARRFTPTEEEPLAERKSRRVLQDVKRRMTEVASEDVVISAEGFDNLSREEFERFIAIVPHSDIRVIGYVRGPHSFIESAFSQRVKSGLSNLIPSRLMPDYERLAKYTDRSDVQLVKFDRDVLYENCVVRDFCRRAGIHIEPEEVLTENTSLTMPAIELLIAFNRWRASVGLGRVRGYVVAAALKGLEGEKFKLRREATAAAIEQHRDRIAWMERCIGEPFDEAPTDEGLMGDTDIALPREEALQWLMRRLAKPWTGTPTAQQVGVLMQTFYELASARHSTNTSFPQDE